MAGTSISTRTDHSPKLTIWLATLATVTGSLQALGDRPAVTGRGDRPDVVLLHSYQTGFASEVANTISVSAATLEPLLPDGYALAPASTLGLGSDDEGLVVIFNFYGTNNFIDRRKSRQCSSTRIDLLILVNEPAWARLIDADIPGAFHFYTLDYFTDDAEFAASLTSADLPVAFVPRITFDAELNNVGEGVIAVDVPFRGSPFYSDNTMFAYAPAAPLNGIFWYEGRKGTLALHFQIDEPRQGPALSFIFTEPGSPLNSLLDGGGLGPGPDDSLTGFQSVVTPSLNLHYPNGSRGRLVMIRRPNDRG
jgi:hypothetical protein